MNKDRWKIPKEPDIYSKVMKVKGDMKEKTISKTIIFLIRYAYDKLYRKKG